MRSIALPAALLLATLATRSFAQDPALPPGRVENLSVRRAAGGIVEISYALRADGAGTFTVALSVSIANRRLPATAVSGDVGRGITPGATKRIVWQAGRDVEELTVDRFKYDVTATAEAPPLPPAIRDPLTADGWTTTQYDTSSLTPQEARGLAENCRWMFGADGLRAQNRSNWNCPSPGGTTIAGPFRAEIRVQKIQGGDKAYAGLLFGFQDWSNYSRLAIHPSFDQGDVDLLQFSNGKVTSAKYFSALAEERRSAFTLAIEVRDQTVLLFLNNRQVAKEQIAGASRGQLKLLVGGDDQGAYLFRDLSIVYLPK
jgi:hypothetical protein